MSNPDFDDNALLEKAGHIAIKFIASMISILAIVIIYGKIVGNQQEPYTPVTFTNVDPSIPATEIKSRDYANRTVTYREYGTPPKNTIFEETQKSNNGYVIKGKNGVDINTGLSREDIIRQVMDGADIYDLQDYLGNDLR